MDDPGWSWPAWKFGLKRSDLFDSLHDQYNTFAFSLQDPEAFHADVSQVANEARSKDEFHRLMADRQQQRIRELHQSLGSLAVEIIANPKLMDSEHWQYAVQLFRTKSFDSLVRYFASYLPEGSMPRPPTESRSGSVSSSYSDAASVYTTSTKASSVDDASSSPSQYYTHASFTDGPVMTEEPSKMYDDDAHVNAPLSPPASELMEESSTAAASPSADSLDARSHLSSNPPSRSMSFSGSDAGSFVPGFCHALLHRRDDDDEEECDTSQSDDCDTATTSSVSDCAESRSSIESIESIHPIENHKEHVAPLYMDDDEVDDFDEDELLTAQFPEDTFDVLDLDEDKTENDSTPEVDETPTPRQEAIMTSYLEYKSANPRRLPSPQYRRSPSPTSHKRPGPYSRDTVKRSPDEAHSKIQKPSSDLIKRRPRDRI
jgi:hypothetical protein